MGLSVCRDESERVDEKHGPARSLDFVRED